jgi:hypothetical protein
MELRIEENAPSMVIRMHHIHCLAVPNYRAPFICPLEDGALEVKDIFESRSNQTGGSAA